MPRAALLDLDASTCWQSTSRPPASSQYRTSHRKNAHSGLIQQRCVPLAAQHEAGTARPPAAVTGPPTAVLTGRAAGEAGTTPPSPLGGGWGRARRSGSLSALRRSTEKGEKGEGFEWH